jgi:hypothetical protein
MFATSRSPLLLLLESKRFANSRCFCSCKCALSLFCNWMFSSDLDFLLRQRLNIVDIAPTAIKLWCTSKKTYRQAFFVVANMKQTVQTLDWTFWPRCRPLPRWLSTRSCLGQWIAGRWCTRLACINYKNKNKTEKLLADVLPSLDRPQSPPPDMSMDTNDPSNISIY